MFCYKTNMSSILTTVALCREFSWYVNIDFFALIFCHKMEHLISTSILRKVVKFTSKIIWKTISRYPALTQKDVGIAKRSYFNQLIIISYIR